MKNKGFTLIEILVVVSIIGIIAAVIMTNLNSGKEKAVGIKSVTELDQFKKALELYRTDNGKYPAEGEDKFYSNDPGEKEADPIDNFLKMELLDKGYISEIPYYVAFNSGVGSFNYFTGSEINNYRDRVNPYYCEGQNPVPDFNSYAIFFLSPNDLNIPKCCTAGQCIYYFGQ